MGSLALCYAVLVAGMSLVAVVAYGFDKRRAVVGGRRVPEQTLHVIALLGGWPGALTGQQLFRHKTQKLGFRIVFWCVVLVHIAVVSGIFFLLWTH